MKKKKYHKMNEKIKHRNLIHFFNNVIIKLGYYDWKINLCNNNYCWIKSKIIDIDLSYKGDIHQMILHEISHIDTAKYCNQKHNIDFWKKLEYLNSKFLKKDLDNYQKKHKEYTTIGFYKRCYKN